MNHSKTIMNLIGLRVSMSSLFTEGNYDDTNYFSTTTCYSVVSIATTLSIL